MDSLTEPRHRWRDLAASAIVLVLTLGLYVGLELATPYYFLWDDNASFFLPCYVLNAETLLEHGALPHVNPHQYLGYAYLGSGQTGALYPPVYLAHGLARIAWGDARPMVDILAIGHLLVAALGMLVLLRRFRVGRIPAILGALLWVSFPFLGQVTRNWVFVSYAAAWMPWSLYLTERLFSDEPPSGRWPDLRLALALAVVKALLFYQGYVQYAVLTALYEGVYVVWRGVLRPGHWASWRRGALGYGVALLATGALAAPQLVPMLVAKQASAARAEALSYEEFLSNALDPAVFLRAQGFDMAENAVHRSTGALYYVGLPVLLAALLVPWLAWRRQPPARRLAAALLAASTAFVLSTTVAGILHAVPLLGSFRWPFKGFLVVLLYLTVASVGVAGHGWALGCRWRRGLSTALLLAGISGNVFVAVVEPWNRTFGPNRLREDVSTFRERAESRFPVESGRLISMWMSHGEPEIERLLVHNYATLAGAYHLGGYDPLISELNLELAVGLDYSNIWRYELTQDALDYLSGWSVRYLLVPQQAHFSAIFARFPQLRLAWSGDRMEVWENAAALPFAFFLNEGPGGPPVDVTWLPDGLELAIGGRGGRLRVNIAPLPGYIWSADGGVQEGLDVDDDRHLVLEVPPGTQQVRLRYVDVPFRIGSLVALGFVVPVVALAVLRRRRGRLNPGKSGDGRRVKAGRR